MAMTKQMWSISGLSVELDLDRRTLAKHLEHVDYETDGKHKVYRLKDVVAVLKEVRRTPPTLRQIETEMLTAIWKEDVPKFWFALIEATAGPMALGLKAEVPLESADIWHAISVCFLVQWHRLEDMLQLPEGMNLDVDQYPTLKKLCERDGDGQAELSAWLDQQQPNGKLKAVNGSADHKAKSVKGVIHHG
jgi:hypothetical protein